jgi:hypothetical protein
LSFFFFEIRELSFNYQKADYNPWLRLPLAKTDNRQACQSFAGDGESTDACLAHLSAKELTSLLTNLTSKEIKDMPNSLISCQIPAIIDLSLVIDLTALTRI